MSIIVVVVACVVAIFGIYRVVTVSRQVGEYFRDAFQRNTLFATVRSITSCLLAPTVVMAVFVGLSGKANRVWERRNTKIQQVIEKITGENLFEKIVGENHTTQQPQTNTIVSQQNIVNIIGEPIETASTSHRLSSGAGADLAANRPQWIADGDLTSGDVRQIVLSSGLWSTVEEATQELQQRAVAIFKEDFQRRHRGWFDLAGPHFIGDEQVIEIGVKDRYLERTEQDSGKYTFPMNRIWWKVEVSPLVRTELYPKWKATVVRNRIVMIGGGLALLTLIANVSALFATLKSVAKRSSLEAAAVSAVCATTWVVADFFLVKTLLS